MPNGSGIQELLKAVPELVNLIKSSGEAAGQLATLENRLRVSGINVSDFLTKLRQETKGTRTDIDLLKTALDFNRTGASLEQIPKLVGFAGQRATVLQKSLAEISESLTNFPKEGAEDLTRKLGFSKEFSDQIISRTRNLDKLGKQRVFYNTILSDEFARTDQLSKVNLKAANSAERLSTAYDNFWAATDKLFSPLQIPTTALLNGIGGFINFLNAGFSNEKDDLAKSKESFRQAFMGGLGFTDMFEEFERLQNSLPQPMIAHGNRTHQQSPAASLSSQSVDPRTLPNAEIEKLPVKTASDVATKFYTQMKDTKLATVELGKSFQQTGQQASKALEEMSQDAKTTGLSLSTISSTGALIGKTIAQGIESGTGALKAALKKILTMLLDFLEKELLAAQAAATLRTLFGDFSAIAQIAAGIAAIEFAKVAVNSFAQGGWINEPVIGRGLRSGQMYTLGERGPEYVMSNNQLQSARFANSFDTSRIEKAFSNLQLRTEIRGTNLAVIVERGNRVNRRRRL